MPATNERKHVPAKTGTSMPSKSLAKNKASKDSVKSAKTTALSDKQRKLLERQGALIKIIEAQGTFVPANPVEVSQGSEKNTPSKARVRDLAKRLGIWTAKGKLTPSYNK